MTDLVRSGHRRPRHVASTLLAASMLLAALAVAGGAGASAAARAVGAAERSSAPSSNPHVECPTLNDDPDDPAGALVVLVDGTTSSVA